MLILLNRRQILTGLLGLGASVAFASPVEQVSTHLVDLEWQRLATDPWFFDIIDVDGTISESTAVEPSVYSDLFPIAEADLATTAGLINQVERYAPLTAVFRMTAVSELEDVRDQLLRGNATLEPKVRKSLRALEADLEDEENGWAELVRHEGEASLPRFRAMVQEWLADSIEWELLETFPRYSGGQGIALGFFEDLDEDVRSALDIEIVNGDQPGSSYVGAQLHWGIDEANAKAAELGLPFRFRDAS